MKRWLCIALLTLVALPTMAQDKALPRVLMIGDSIYSQHCRGVSSDLKGRANVVTATWPADVVPSSSTAIEYLDTLLGKIDRNGNPVPEDKQPKWDLIHVNVGLGDLIHRVPNLKSFRVLPIESGGVINTSPKNYEANLDQLIRRLKATGAQVVWASTTPIRASTSNVFEPGKEIEYNAIAAKVMAKHDVPSNDMHVYVKSLIDMDKPAGHGADPFNFDKKPIHMPVVRVIEKAFGLKPMAETEEEKAVKKAKAEPKPAQS